MTSITSIALATASGTEMARDLMRDIACQSPNDQPDALYEIVVDLTRRQSDIDDVVLKALLHKVQKQLGHAMLSTATLRQFDDPIVLARHIAYGCVNEWFCDGYDPLRADSIDAWCASQYAAFVDECKNRDDLPQLLVAWKEGYDSKLREYREGRNEGGLKDFIQPMVAWHQLHAAAPHRQPAQGQSATHKPFLVGRSTDA